MLVVFHPRGGGGRSGALLSPLLLDAAAFCNAHVAELASQRCHDAEQEQEQIPEDLANPSTWRDLHLSLSAAL